MLTTDTQVHAERAATLDGLVEVQVFKTNEGTYWASAVPIEEDGKEIEDDAPSPPWEAEMDARDFVPKFSSLEDAREYAMLTIAISNAEDDMDAFNAPSECYGPALGGLNARLSELLDRAV